MMITLEDTITFDYTFKTDNQQMGESHNFTTTLNNEKLLRCIRNFFSTLVEKEKEEVINKTTNLIISPKDAFGEKHAELISAIPKTMMEGYKVDDHVLLHTEDGKELPGIIKEENDTTFIVDCNHPLADKTFEVELTIRNIE